MRVIPILSNQRLYTTDSPTFAGLTLTGSMSIVGDIEMGDGNYIGQAAGPLVRFDDTLDYLEITGCKVGIGDTAPGTLLQLKGADAYLTLQNETAENSAGGCETKIIFEDHGNNALGQIEISHVGSADDEKGQFIISTNNDSGLQTALTISEAQLATFTGNILIPDVGTIGSASGTSAITIEADSDILLAGKLGVGITPAAVIHGFIAATTGSSPLEVLRLECNDGGVELDAGMGPAVDFYLPHNTASFLGAAIAARKESNVDDAESTNLIFSTCPDAGSSTIRMRIGDGGEVGIGLDVDAGTLLQLALDGNAYLTLQNLTAENGEGGAETRIIFEDHANNALMQIEGSHSGTSDDTKGKLIISINNASGLTTALTIIDTLAATFVGAIASSNYGAVNKLTACASNAGELDFTAGTKKLDVEDSAVVSQDYTSDSTTVVLAALGLTANGAALTLKNDQNEHGEGGAESLIKFTDHTDTILAQIEGSHSGTSDDTKGKLILSVHNNSSLTTAVTIIDTLAVTFAGAIGSTNFEAANKLTVCATNAGEIDFTGSTKKLDVEDASVVNQDLTTDADVTFNDITVSTPSNIYGLSHNSFTDYDANKHVDHTGVSVTAGKGLSGGGAISSTVSLALDLTEMTGNVTWDDGSTDASITWTYALSGANDPVWTIGSNSMDLTTGVLKVGGTTVSAVGHTHDGATLQLDGITSDGGAFAFTTSGDVTFDESIIVEGGGFTLGKNGVGGTAATITLRDGANPGTTATLTYAKWADLEAATGIVVCDGSGDYSAVNIGTEVQAHGDVLDDLNTLTAPASDGQFIVATGIGAFAYESTTTARTSLGVGTGDSPAFAAVSLGTGELTAGSVNRASGTLLLEIGGTPELSISATASTFGGNIVVPDAADIGSASATNAISISGTGIVDIELHNAATIGLALAGTLITSTAAELNLLDGITAVQEQADVLDDLIGVGTVTDDSYFLVGTGAASFAWETTTTLRTSIGVGTGNTVQFAALKLGTANLKSGALFELAEDAANAELVISCYHDTEATTPLITLRKADNNEAAPALVDDNAVLGTIHFDGYDGSGWHTGAKIEARVQGTPSDATDMPTEITFWTCPEDSATLVERMTIDETGNVGIGTVGTAPAAKLEVVPVAGQSIQFGNNNFRLIRSNGGYSIELIHEATAIADDAVLGYLRGVGNENGAGAVIASEIQFVADADWVNNTSCAARMQFYTCPIASATKLVRMTILSDGKVGINDVAPGEQLDVNGNINVTGVYKVGDVQVVTSPQTHIVDASTQDLAGSDNIDETKLEADMAGFVTTINAILTALETHGLLDDGA